MRKFAVIAAIALIATSAWACRTWTTTTFVGGKMVICNCMDCGAGATCTCF